MRSARRLESLPLYVFATLDAKLKALRDQGVDIIKLDIGSPDGPPPEFIVDQLYRSASDPTRHGYAGYTGTPRLRQAMVDYYGRRFGVALRAADQVLPLAGKQRGHRQHGAGLARSW